MRTPEMAESKIEFDFDQANALFGRLAVKMTDMTPVMDQIGEILTTSTKQRFQQGIAPDGTPWAPNSEATLARKRGSKPLIGRTRLLGRLITSEASPTGVSWGSNLIYAAVQQMGAAEGVFGQNANGDPLPWGNIPARPFIGMSDNDRAAIITTLEAFIVND